MFGVGMPEVILILVVALMVFGPKRLPELARTVGKAVGRFKAATRSVQQEIEREMRRMPDPRQGLDDLITPSTPTPSDTPPGEPANPQAPPTPSDTPPEQPTNPQAPPPADTPR